MKSKYVANTDCGYEIGDIVAGCSHWGCTRPYFYRILARKGRTQFTLQELEIAYDSAYLTNSPCYLAVPADYYEGDGKTWYTSQNNKLYDIVTARVIRFDMDYSPEPSYNLKLVGAMYGPLLSKWDGKPVCGNCD